MEDAEAAAAAGARIGFPIVLKAKGPVHKSDIGGVNYPAFGPLVMVGMGGVMADLLADRAFRVPPVADAAAMIEELRCAPLLHGYRGSPPVDIPALAGQLERVGRLLEDLPQVAELDLNPVVVTPEGATTVDARTDWPPVIPRPHHCSGACADQRLQPSGTSGPTSHSLPEL
ncbi:acetate--CoA ligase family protein [Nonomuraea sp. ATR24]|uniref:acetate--CoA ligase family protein n=1 Tax=Nonomuraea sp. ATR24 TaxID=1676744 RepID=UPI0035C1B9BF